MSKILVVDDESLIREWLVMCLQSAGFSRDSIHEASNGEEALQLVKIHSYSLIFTDITMPKLDGITLIKSIRELDTHVKLIILTCHDDFDFARSALKYNVYEYLLKNELCKEDIADIVSRTLPVSPVQGDEQKYRNEFLRGLLYHDSSDTVTQKELDEHHINLEQGPYFALAFNDSLRNVDNIDWSINRQISHVTTFYNGIHMSLFIANLSCPPALYNEVILHTKNLILRHNSEKNHIGCSSIYQDSAQLPTALKEAVLSWELQFFSCDTNCPVQIHMADTLDKSKRQMIHEKKSEILTHYALNGPELSKKLILNLCTDFNNTELWDSNLLKRTIIDLMEGIDNHYDTGVHVKDYISIITNASQVETIFNCIEQFFSTLPELNNMTDYIKDTKEYISMHYNQPLTLASLAERVHLSEEYFSRLFKKEIGKNFTEYLTEIRMIRAKQLLQSSSFNINEIGEMVGIQNPSYFSSQFKRYYGISPKTARENRT